VCGFCDRRVNTTQKLGELRGDGRKATESGAISKASRKSRMPPIDPGFVHWTASSDLHCYILNTKTMK
jgi:hypothetical protein